MKKRYDIVYVTQDSLQEGIGMSQIVPVVIGLASRGWKVGVLSCEKKTETDLVEKRLKLAGVDWHVLNFGSRGPLGGAIRILRIAFSLPSGKFYHCRSDMAAAACALRFKRNILWDVRSLWIDQKIIIENISPNSICLKSVDEGRILASTHNLNSVEKDLPSWETLFLIFWWHLVQQF